MKANVMCARAEDPEPEPRDSAEELRELIRVKIDIYGLTQEDIEFLKEHAQKMAAERNGEKRNQ